MLEFTIVQPPKSLLGEVECFRLVTCPAKGRLAIKVCPNGLPGIVFQHRHGQSAIENIVTDSGRVVSTPLLFVHGQITEITVMNFVGPFTTIQAVLKPYALKTLFGLNATELTDGSTTLERLCRGSRLRVISIARSARRTTTRGASRDSRTFSNASSPAFEIGTSWWKPASS